jgi:uncharacterized protein YrzB (UPF0473 family)
MSEKQEEYGMDLEYEILTLTDDDGVEHQFEVVDSAELDGKEYMALVPVYEKPEELLDDSGDLIVLKVVEDDGEEYLDSIEDEEEFDKVSTFFMQRLSETFDFEESEEE